MPKKLDLMHGLNTYDYGARQHDPILARWDRMDPHSEDYQDVSPYVYCHNNPVMRIDPDGKDDHYTLDGKFIKRDDKETNYVFAGDNQLMYKGQPITGESFNNMASTIYAESSIGYGIADSKEMYAIASVHLRNSIAFGQKAPLAQKFR